MDMKPVGLCSDYNRGTEGRGKYGSDKSTKMGRDTKSPCIDVGSTIKCVISNLLLSN